VEESNPDITATRPCGVRAAVFPRRALAREVGEKSKNFGSLPKPFVMTRSCYGDNPRHYVGIIRARIKRQIESRAKRLSPEQREALLESELQRSLAELEGFSHPIETKELLFAAVCCDLEYATKPFCCGRVCLARARKSAKS
jgi:hypothetical protein